ncbi:MAG: recombinase family protein [bacterium]|nr:recombinase family protein [bacterium]
MAQAIGYLRVSTTDQAENGVSLDLQREKLEAMATVQDLDLAEIITDAGASAKTLRRPGMARLLDLVDAGDVGTVIVYKLDRLTRSVRDLGDLLERFERRGASLVSVSESLDTGTAAGRLVLNVMASVAQWERETIAERTREALQSMKARGERVGTISFGYRLAADGVHLEEDRDEQAVLSTLRELRAAGYTLRAIADELNAQGFTTRRGSAWRHQYVANVLKAAA